MKEVKQQDVDGNVKNKIMEKAKQIINHPLSKAVLAGACGAMLLLESHPMYAGVAFGYSFREILLAFKSE